MKRAALVLASAGALFFLYFFGLTRTGLIGPDEPRYAAIGRAMASTGDWITPRLWGSPWFEKPPLLYWMTAAGFKLGLGPETAPRFPVALVSVAFLAYFFIVLRREFGERAAWYSTALLATSAGWVAYSRVAVTDLPMSAAFAAAMLALAIGPRTRATAVAAGVLLGVAVLAKGLVPLALFVPALWFFRRRIIDLVLVFVSAAVIAAPWYAVVTARNGTAFLNDFFWKHHFGRFLTPALQHGQPVWFYVPVLLAGLFPWTPLIALPFTRWFPRDTRMHFLLAWFGWGFVFFSASRNKLPGYLLPLLPAVAVLMGVGLEKTRRARYWLAACGALFFLVPPIINVLPQALASGISHVPFHMSVPAILAAAALGAACAAIGRWGGAAGIGALATLTVAAVVWRAYPELDRRLSGRQMQSVTCVAATNRSQHYSIDYYARQYLPDCK